MNDKNSMILTYADEIKRALISETGHPIHITTSPTGDYDFLDKNDENCNTTPYMAAMNIMVKFADQIKDNGIAGFQKGVLVGILERLINDKPLTPIEDEPDMWEILSSHEKSHTVYQCMRYPSLFKTVYDDGKVKYNDARRFVAEDISANGHLHLDDCKIITNIMENCHPITMPYYPAIEPIRISYSAFHHKPDMNSIGWWNAIDTIGIEDPIDGHNIYFQEVEGADGYKWKEISEEDYVPRLNNNIYEMLDVIKVNAIYYHDGSDGFVEIINNNISKGAYMDVEYRCIGDTTNTIKRAPKVDFVNKYIWKYLGMDFADVIARIYEAGALNSFNIPDHQKDYLRKTYPQYVGPHPIEPYYK